MEKIKKVQPIKSVVKTQEQILQEAAELLMQDIKLREQKAMEEVQKALSEIQEKYKVSIIITQPQLIVKSN